MPVPYYTGCCVLYVRTTTRPAEMLYDNVEFYVAVIVEYTFSILPDNRDGATLPSIVYFLIISEG